MNKPVISVVIPTLGRTKELEFCLDALARQTFPDFEVIIVTDIEERLMHFKTQYANLSITVKAQKEKGLTSARNRGFEVARGDVISFIDDDVVVTETWLQEVLQTFKNSPDIGGVSGPTIIPENMSGNRDILAFQKNSGGNLFWRIVGKIYSYFVLENNPDTIGKIYKSGAFSLGSNFKESTLITKQFEVDYLEACNMNFRKSVIDTIGFFSPEYLGLGDWSEPDLAFRVKKAGYRLVYNPKAIVNHCISQKGVFEQRGNDSCQRMINFVHFYFKWNRLNLEKSVRFGFNLLFQNLYWCYKFAQTGNVNWLSGIWGTMLGLGGTLCK